MTVWFTPIARQVMVEHCKAVYPREGCGILVGKQTPSGWLIARSVPVPNKKAEERSDRFEIDPRDYLRVEREVEREGWHIVGFFHSHPDVPPHPSATDAAFAWANYLTVIVAVYGGTKVRVRAHWFQGAEEGFKEVPVVVALQPIPIREVPEMPPPQRVVELVGEVEPFVSLAVRKVLEEVAAGTFVLFRFDYEPTLSSLPHLLERDGHAVLMVRWNEEGAWEVFVRTRSER
jgi:proteasome lid subunit RPN8/RPN11/TusA-related sulfurtransferase